MNNCPKCGNPLQAGVTSCPICGTDISNTINNKVEQSNIKVASVGQAPNQVSQPVAPQPTVSVTKEQVQPQPQVQVEQQAVTPQQPVSNSISDQPIAPVQVSTPSQNVVQSAATTNQISTPTQEQAPQQIDPNSLAPNIPKVELSTPVPSIPSSLTDNGAGNPSTLNVSSTPEVKPAPKKKGNKTIMVVALIVVIALVGGGAFMMMNNNTSPAPINNNQAANLAKISLSSNGYKIDLKDGWLTVEDGSNVIITNTSETVAIKLNHSTGNISEISEDYIKSYMASNPSYTNTEVTTTKISDKDTLVVNSTINSIPVQVYFINGGSNLILSVSIVYQSSDSKSKFEAEVQEMIGTLSYADESIKAISTIDMYKDQFGLSDAIINNRNNPTINNATTNEQETNQQTTDENTTTPETTNPSTNNQETNQTTEENQTNTSTENTPIE